MSPETFASRYSVYMNSDSKTWSKIDGVYIADTARVTGEVTIGEGASIWYGAVIRGDVAKITIGSGTNVQDNAVIHCDSGKPNTIGHNVTIGHGAIVHGASIGDGTLIGMGATVLGETVIGKNCLVAAGCVVPPRLEVPDGHLVVGVPGKVARAINDKDREYLKWLPPHYTELAERYFNNPDDPKLKLWSGNTD